MWLLMWRYFTLIFSSHIMEHSVEVGIRIEVMLRLLLLMVGLMSFQVSAEIYRWVDENGQIRYSPTPREGAVPIDIDLGNAAKKKTATTKKAQSTTEPVRSIPTTKLSPKPDRVTKDVTKRSVKQEKITSKLRDEKSSSSGLEGIRSEYKSLIIKYPVAGKTSISPTKRVSVHLESSPKRLKVGHHYRVMLNGLLMAGKHRQNKFRINVPSYNYYEMTAVIVDKKGRIVMESDPVVFNLVHKAPSRNKEKKPLAYDPADPYKPNFDVSTNPNGNPYAPNYAPGAGSSNNGNFGIHHEFF